MTVGTALRDRPGPRVSAFPRAAVAVVHFGSLSETRATIESVLCLDYPDTTVILVHNGTHPESRPLVDEFPMVFHEVVPQNRGYAAGVNRAVTVAERLGAKYLYALNNDLHVPPDGLQALVDLCEADPAVGVAGGIHYYRDRPEIIQNTGSYIDWGTGAVRCPDDGQTDEGQIAPLAEPDFLCGAALFFPLSTHDRIGGLDERFFLYSEESDWCFRIRAAGLRVVRVAGAKIFHGGGAAVKRHPGVYEFYATRNKAWLIRRWAPRRALLRFLIGYFVYRYPRMLIGCLVRGEWLRFRKTAQGIVHGWTRSPHE